MIQPTHDEVIAWIYERLDGDNPAQNSFRASLLANRDVLERHSYQLVYGKEPFSCYECKTSAIKAEHCPTYLDILQRIAEVM